MIKKWKFFSSQLQPISDITPRPRLFQDFNLVSISPGYSKVSAHPLTPRVRKVTYLQAAHSITSLVIRQHCDSSHRQTRFHVYLRSLCVRPSKSQNYGCFESQKWNSAYSLNIISTLKLSEFIRRTKVNKCLKIFQLMVPNMPEVQNSENYD